MNNTKISRRSFLAAAGIAGAAAALTACGSSASSTASSVAGSAAASSEAAGNCSLYFSNKIPTFVIVGAVIIVAISCIFYRKYAMTITRERTNN